IADRVLDRELRRQAHDMDALDIAGAQQLVEVRPPEAAIAITRDADLTRLRLEAGKGRGAPRSAFHCAELLDGDEQAAISRQVGIILGEADMDMRHRPTAGSRQGEHGAAGMEKDVRLARVAVEGEGDA